MAASSGVILSTEEHVVGDERLFASSPTVIKPLEGSRNGVSTISGFKWNLPEDKGAPNRFRGTAWKCKRVRTFEARISDKIAEKDAPKRSTRAMRQAGSQEATTSSAAPYQESSAASSAASAVTAGGSLDLRGDTDPAILKVVHSAMQEDPKLLIRRLKDGCEHDFQGAHCNGNDYLLKDASNTPHLVVVMTRRTGVSRGFHVVHDPTIGFAIQSFLVNRGVSHIALREFALSSFAISAPRKRGVPGMLGGNVLGFKNARAMKRGVTCHGLISVVWVSDAFHCRVRTECDPEHNTYGIFEQPQNRQVSSFGCTTWELAGILRNVLAAISEARLLAPEFNQSYLIVGSKTTPARVEAMFEGSSLGSRVTNAIVFDAHALCCNRRVAIKEVPKFPKSKTLMIISKRHNNLWGIMRPNEPISLKTRFDVFEDEAKYCFAKQTSPSMIWLSYTNDAATGFRSEVVNYSFLPAIGDRTVSRLAIEDAVPWSGLPWGLRLSEKAEKSMRRKFVRRNENLNDD